MDREGVREGSPRKGYLSAKGRLFNGEKGYIDKGRSKVIGRVTLRSG